MRSDGPPAELPEAAVLETLSAAASGALFVSQLLAATRRRGVADGAAAAALVELERRGDVLTRDHFCADPHLDGVDLRVSARVGGGAARRDEAYADALARLEATWNRWLGEYLANHRCS